jgi:hypothetical protein
MRRLQPALTVAVLVSAIATPPSASADDPPTIAPMDLILEHEDGGRVWETASRSDGHLVGVVEPHDGPEMMGAVVENDEGVVVDEFAFPQGSGPGEIGGWITDIAVDPDDNLIVVDWTNDRIVVFDEDFDYLHDFGNPDVGPSVFADACGVAADSGGRIIVGDRTTHRVRIFTPEGSSVTSFGGPGVLLSPCQIAVTPDDEIVVADTGSLTVQVFSSAGTYLETIREGPGPEETLSSVAINSLGEIFIGWVTGIRGDCCGGDTSIEAYAPGGDLMWRVHNFGPDDQLDEAQLVMLPDDRMIQTGHHGYFGVWAYRECFGRRATLLGTDDPETLTGTHHNDVIVGLGGDDVLNGGAGNDRLCSGPGDDEVYGGPGKDRIIGKGGNDLLSGGGGKDRIIGAAGNDELIGGAGNDILKGNRGTDTGDGGPGSDKCRVETPINCER